MYKIEYKKSVLLQVWSYTGVNQRTGTGQSLTGSQNGLTNKTGKENGIIAQIHDF